VTPALLLVLLADVSARREPLDLPTSALAREIHAAPAGVFAVTVSRGLGLAAAGRRDGRVQVWDAGTWARRADFPAHQGYCYAAVFSPDGRRLATAGLDGAVHLWDAGGWILHKTLRPGGGAVTSLAFAAGGRLVGGGPSGVYTWDADGAETLLSPHGASAVAAAGRRAAAAGHDGTVRVWDLDAGAELHAFGGHPGGAWAVAFHPRGRWLASAGADGALRGWPLAAGEPARRFAADGPVEARALVFTLGGRHLASAGRGGVHVWDVEDLRRLRALGAAPSFGLCLGIEGRELVATGGDNHVRVWTSGATGLPSTASDRPMGFLGITYVDDPGGVRVQGVTPGSEAERTGLQPGDVITAVDGRPVGATDDLLRFMRTTREGDEVEVRLDRAGAGRLLRVKLGRWGDGR
jgi:WD40 repeat protein